MSARTSFVGLLLLLTGCGAASAVSAPPPRSAPELPRWETLASPTSESLRGLSVVSDYVVWASGAHGTVLRTIDAGRTWSLVSIPGAEALDLRNLHAFDADHAIALAAGAPARAFRTEDGGATWTETFTRDVPGIFFDSLAFWDAREGIAIGDPLPSATGPRFAVIVTHDGGVTWEDREGPLAEPGEAAFAASNGVIALPAPGVAVFATGGAASHVFRSEGGAWTSASADVAFGGTSAGVFAIAFGDARHGYVVGGDYSQPTSAGSFARSADGGLTWHAGPALRGYRSSIAIGDGVLLVAGTSGSEVSRDDGATWAPIEGEALNSVAIAESIAFAIGPEGRLVRAALSELQ